MALTTQDRIECKEIAREIVQEVLKIHIKTCPHYQTFLVTKAKLVGLFIGVIIASAVSSTGAATIVMKILM